MPIVHDKFEQLPNGKWRPVVSKPAAVANDGRLNVDPIGDALADRIVNNLVGERRRNNALDAAADNEIRSLLPKLTKMAKDGKEKEAQALGLEGEKEDEDTELQRGQVTGNDDEETMTIAERIAAGYRAAKGFWRKSATRNRQRSQFVGSTGRYPSATDSSTAKTSKHDLVAANAKAARQTSGFARF